MKLFITLSIVCMLCACASIPPAGSELSRLLGSRIAAMEEAHIATVHAFFDEKRAKVREFLAEQWIPQFAANYLTNAQVADTLRQACAEKPSSDCLRAMTIVTTAAQQQINAKYREMLAPLDTTEALVIQKLRAEYAQMLTMNIALTNLLQSASDVELARGELLAEVGINEAALRPVLLEVDDAIGSLNANIEDLEARIENYQQRLDAIRRLIRNSGRGDEPTNDNRNP